MRDSEIIETILSSSILPPTLAAELVKALPTLPTEKVAWVVCLLQQADEADRRYSAAATQVTELLRANSVRIEQEVLSATAPVLTDIMAEFDKELELLIKCD